MIPATDLKCLRGNSVFLGDFEGEIGGTSRINRGEIDFQRRRSIESGRADKKSEMHSAERYSK
jgi:hypothetical protein